MQCHTNVVPVFEELDPQPTFFPPSPSPSTVSGLLGSAAAALAGDTPNGSAEAGAAGAAAVGAPEAGVADNVAAEAAAGGLHHMPLPLGASTGQRSLKSEKLEGMRRVVVLAVAVTGLLYSCVGELWPGWRGLLRFQHAVDAVLPTCGVCPLCRPAPWPAATADSRLLLAVVELRTLSQPPLHFTPGASRLPGLLPDRAPVDSGLLFFALSPVQAGRLPAGQCSCFDSGLVLCCCLPAAGLAGYLAFPASARSDIMLSFGEDDLLIQVTRLLGFPGDVAARQTCCLADKLRLLQADTTANRTQPRICTCATAAQLPATEPLLLLLLLLLLLQDFVPDCGTPEMISSLCRLPAPRWASSKSPPT